MKRLISVLLVFILAFSLVSCSGNRENDHNLHIISSIFPSYDFAKQLTKGVDGVRISMLISPGTEPHSYEPGVQDMAQIKECDLFIYLGGESDQWVESLLDSFDDGEVNTLKMLECVEVLREESLEGMQTHSHQDGEVHAHGENDEHVWTSPVNAILISEKIKNKLVEADPDNARTYEKNFKSYKAELETLDKSFSDIFSQNQKPLIVADRFPFRYLSEQYGFDCYAAFPGCSTESDPSAATIAFLENKIKQTNSSAVFYTEFSSQKVADTLCESTGAKKLMLHSCHNVNKDDFENSVSYVSLMTQNINNIKEALK